VEKPKATFPHYLEIPQVQRDSHFPTTPTAAMSFEEKVKVAMNTISAHLANHEVEGIQPPVG
jgi:hypothetical protein